LAKFYLIIRKKHQTVSMVIWQTVTAGIIHSQWNNGHIRYVWLVQYSYRQQIHFFQEPFADRHQRLFRPFMEPVDTRAVGDGWELTTPHTQCIAHRWETQHHLWSENKSKIHKLYILLITILRHLHFLFRYIYTCVLLLLLFF